MIKAIDHEQIKRIQNIPYIKNSRFSKLDFSQTLLFFYKRYVSQMEDYITSEGKLAIDVGCGLGWLSMAIAKYSEMKVIAVEPNKTFLNTAAEISKILELDDKIEWINGSINNLIENNIYGDIVFCIEVIEHVNKEKTILRELSKITKDILILTTPNLLFPVIQHDTRLPFCHWLPIKMRKKYARFFNRLHLDESNLFWSPFEIKKHLSEFEIVSGWLHYSSFEKFMNTFPFYLPYGDDNIPGSYVTSLGMLKKYYYNIISKMGKHSFYFTPTIAAAFKKKNAVISI